MQAGVASKRPIGTRPGDGHKGEVNMFVQVIQGHVSDGAQVRAARQMGPGGGPWSCGMAGQHIGGY